MSRTKKSIINLMTAVIGQVLGLIVSFVARIFFIRTLGSEYLGLNGLFTNILTVLSLAELGVGTAITYSLYEPLANNDIYKCKMLMQLYKRIYNIIGIFIIVAGILIIPILPIFVKDFHSAENINLVYILFVINTAVSYFFSYKRNLIIADQNRYIATIYRYGFYILLNIVQTVYLILTKNYIGYLFLQILFTLLENIFISIKANKMYPYLKEKERILLDKDSKNEIVKNTKAMMMHKIGGTIVSSTDNLLISGFVNLRDVGIYSNYSMAIYALNLFFTQIYNSLIPSIGNLWATENGQKQYDIFKKIDFLTFWIYGFSTVCLLVLFNPFIELWVGKEFLFGTDVVLILTINFYLTGMRKSVLAFRDATGLFYKDRYKSVIEAVINLVVSIILVIKFGTLGVFIGTLISSLATCVWIEPYILFKYGFHKSFLIYVKEYVKKLIITILITLVTVFLCSFIGGGTLLSFIIKIIICIIVPNTILVILYYRTEEFGFFYHKFIGKIFKHERKEYGRRN